MPAPQSSQSPHLSEARLAELLRPYLGSSPVPDGLYPSLGRYLDLLLRWNARTNLTSIREPEQIAQRHFGESLFAGIHLAGRLPPRATLLDFGSGAGFPGLPMQLLLPDLRVTLAESQGKKAAFLREAVRVLELPTEVWADRVEAMPAERRFDVVALRAVERMKAAAATAQACLAPGGWLVTLASERSTGGESLPIPGLDRGWVNFQQPR